MGIGRPYFAGPALGYRYMEEMSVRQYEWGLLANLVPEQPEEAIKLVPTLQVSLYLVLVAAPQASAA
jgi:hypothetical protein